MPATDSEPTSMEDPHAVKDEEGSLTEIPSSVPPTTVPSSCPLVPTTARPNFTSEAVIETKAVSMASTDCSTALSSPAEASPAKPAVTSPTTIDGNIETSPATSHIASASDSLTCTGTSLINISESKPSLPELPSSRFGSPDQDADFPAVLTFKGVSVTLENNSVWKQFYGVGTEMILTKQGRRMFPYCRYRLSGLDPERKYSLVLSIAPSDRYRYRWNTSRWEVSGPAENQAQGLIRAFSHHYSPCLGSDWMGGLVSFYKLKLTNNSQDHEGHMILHSMHRYIPRLHVIPVPDGVAPTPDQPVVMGPESMTFTFLQTEFMAVTTYQNFRITQLKISHNPFAKGFREDGNNSRLNRIPVGLQPEVKTEALTLKPVELAESMEEVVDLSMKNDIVSAAPHEQETRLVLKPIMSTSASKDDAYVPCMRGNHALGELVLVQKRPRLEPSSVSPVAQKDFRTTPKGISLTPTSTMSTPGSSLRFRKRRKKISRRWGNSRGRLWKAAVVQSPSLTVSTQPELDDVEGLLFVSFTSKEALEVHIRDKPADNSASVSPASTPVRLKQIVDVIPDTHEEKMARLEALLLQDLQGLRHRQVIHPVLQEVGMKLSSLDPTNPIDLQYLGVPLPLPPPNLPERDNARSPGDEGLAFVSRTGKTSDMTKIKGWKNKFIRSKEMSPSNCDGSQKNLSAFCSNMLDEYLESEAQYISERAAAFSTNPEGSVAYELPVKSSSYVKTLDSVLKHRKSASKFSVGTNKPCPLSHKPALYSALMTPAPALARPATPVQARAPSTKSSTPFGSNRTGLVSKRLSSYKQVTSQRSAVNFGQNQWMSQRPAGFTKFQFKLLLMELGAVNEGLNRTQLTPDRLSVALSVVLTKDMQPSQVLRVSHYPAEKSEAPECGQDFCRLGCVCSSLHHLNRGPLHCRRPECMFGCACFKRKITKQTNAGEREEQIQPVYSMTNMEHVVQPRPGSHANKLWKRDVDGDEDPDMLFVPKGAPLPVVPLKSLKRNSVPCPPQQRASQIREEEKGPVYKYLESMMTCARVREFNSKPPEIPMYPSVPCNSTADTTEIKQEMTTDILPKVYYRTVMPVKKSADKTPEGSTSSEADARKQIEIQSACPWDKDRKMVLEALCRRMKHDRLSQRFFIGPYRIRPVAKIFMKKPSGNIVTYRIHISKPSKASDNDEDETDDSDEERHADKSGDEDIESEEEEENEEPEMPLGVAPFLSGVLPAGRLRARTKPVGCQAYGLIQVNGKAYNQARLLLGNMGSLHPANRLAAYVTGRLHAPADVSQKNSQKSDPTNKTNPLGPLHIKAAGTVVPPIITARKTTELKTPAQLPVQGSQPDSWRKGSITLPQLSQNSSTISPVQTIVSGQHSSVGPFQNGSTSSPVSLTVSPSLKTPSFLGQSGTYSFRICPPTNQGTRGQKLPGVTLPGGFTLIQLPKPGAAAAAQQSVSKANVSGLDKALPQKDGLLKFSHLSAKPGWPSLGTLTGGKGLLSSRSGEPGSSRELKCDEKMPSDESDEANGQVDSNLDLEDLSSDSSDYCAEADEDDEVVDIETIEEVDQEMAIAQMKEAVRRAQMSRDSSDDFGSANVQSVTDVQHGDARDKRRRKNHTVLERQRRTEQRNLFDKLQSVLQADPKVPRLRLLSMALREIKHQVDTAKYLEEKKRTLVRLQSVYIRELSLLSGKSEQLIRNKLREICERQKMREKTMKWSPFFSNLLQSRAALLQAITPESEHQPTPLLKPELFMNPFLPFLPKPQTTAAQNSVDQAPKPTPHPLPLAVSSPAQAEVPAPSTQAENQPGELEAPAQVNTSISQMCQPLVPAVAATPPASAGRDRTSPTPITPPSPSLTLPLIRSKTGRIILPSSLKPIGNGFYTLMVLNPKRTGEDGEVNTQPSEADSSNNQDKSHILEEDKTVQSSNSEPKSSGVKTSLLELCRLNKSIFLPSVALQKNRQAGGAVIGLNKMPSAACLSFNSVHQSSAVPTSVKAEPDPSTPVARRGRGRPRKNRLGNNGEPSGEDTNKTVSESEMSVLIEESEKTTVKATEDSPEVVNDNPVSVKRGRGRPPKQRSPSIMQAGSSQSKSNGDSPFRPDTKPKETPDATTLNTSRPLTRGALGKDFPSAKKRSWIDMEKELEPELESESE